MNVARQADDPASILSLYRALLRLRRSEPCLTRGDYRVHTVTDRLFAFERALGEDRIVVALNLGDSPQPFESLRGFILLSTDPGRKAGSEPIGALRPNEGLILRPR